MDRGLRYFGGAVAFGFAAVWIMWSLDAALVCLLSALAGYGTVFAGQHTRAKLAAHAGKPGSSGSRSTPPARRTPEPTELSRRAAELNADVGHVYEPTVTARRPARPEPPADEAATPGESPSHE